MGCAQRQQRPGSSGVGADYEGVLKSLSTGAPLGGFTICVEGTDQCDVTRPDDGSFNIKAEVDFGLGFLTVEGVKVDLGRRIIDGDFVYASLLLDEHSGTIIVESVDVDSPATNEDGIETSDIPHRHNPIDNSSTVQPGADSGTKIKKPRLSRRDSGDTGQIGTSSSPIETVPFSTSPQSSSISLTMNILEINGSPFNRNISLTIKVLDSASGNELYSFVTKESNPTITIPNSPDLTVTIIIAPQDDPTKSVQFADIKIQNGAATMILSLPVQFNPESTLLDPRGNTNTTSDSSVTNPEPAKPPADSGSKDTGKGGRSTR